MQIPGNVEGSIVFWLIYILLWNCFEDDENDVIKAPLFHTFTKQKFYKNFVIL